MEENKNILLILYNLQLYIYDGENWSNVFINDLTSDNNFYHLKKPALISLPNTNTILCTGGSIPSKKFFNKIVYKLDLKKEESNNYSCTLDFKYPDNKYARFMHQMILLDNDNLLIIGGKNEFYCLKSCEQLNLNTGKWTEFPCLNLPRSNFDCISLKGKIYVFGGFSKPGELTKDLIEFYDLKKNNWEILKIKGKYENLTLACSRTMSYDGFNIMIVGGFSGQKLLSDIYEFNTSSNEIDKLGELKNPRSNFHYLIHNDYVHIIGGSFKNINIKENTIENYIEKFTFTLTNDIESENIGMNSKILFSLKGYEENLNEIISEPGFPYSASVIIKGF